MPATPTRPSQEPTDQLPIIDSPVIHRQTPLGLVSKARRAWVRRTDLDGLTVRSIRTLGFLAGVLRLSSMRVDYGEDSAKWLELAAGVHDGAALRQEFHRTGALY